MLNVLFVCSRNQWRSPTAERVFGNDPDLQVRSAGTSKSARRRVTESDVAWADVIIVMESKHHRQLRERFLPALAGKAIHVLDVPDDYRFMDPSLIESLEQSVPPLLT